MLPAAWVRHPGLHGIVDVEISSTMMTNAIDVLFPGGKRVDARIGPFVIQTDQSEKAGGGASAPEPFALFLASIATCAGIFALGFCQARNIDTSDLGLRMECDWDPVRRLYTRMRLLLALPPDFPDKYREGIVKAMELCTVKRHLLEAPSFEVVINEE
jgi:ribosomal protein S12 methylthiotransferase accessory factor